MLNGVRYRGAGHHPAGMDAKRTRQYRLRITPRMTSFKDFRVELAAAIIVEFNVEHHVMKFEETFREGVLTFVECLLRTENQGNQFLALFTGTFGEPFDFSWMAYGCMDFGCHVRDSFDIHA